jgi:DNA-directed RNA polymerase subunit L
MNAPSACVADDGIVCSPRIVDVSIQDAENAREGASVTLHIEDLDEGLGLALADFLLEDERVLFAGYRRSHPLTNRHAVRIDTQRGYEWVQTWRGALGKLEGFVFELDRALRVAEDGATESSNDGVRSERGCAVRLEERCEWDGALHFEGAHVSMLNALRRVVLGEVTTQAISLCRIERNTSLLCDEMVARRLSLIPIRSSAMIRKPDFVPKHAPSSSLSKEEHLESDDDLRTHFCIDSDLKPLNRQAAPMRSQRTVTNLDMLAKSHDPNDVRVNILSHDSKGALVEDAEAAIPITILRPGQSLVVKAWLSRGCGNEHARFSAVSQVRFDITASDTQDGYGGDDEVELVDATIGMQMIGQLTFREVLACACSRLRAHKDGLLRSAHESRLIK